MSHSYIPKLFTGPTANQCFLSLFSYLIFYILQMFFSPIHHYILVGLWKTNLRILEVSSTFFTEWLGKYPPPYSYLLHVTCGTDNIFFFDFETWSIVIGNMFYSCHQLLNVVRWSSLVQMRWETSKPRHALWSPSLIQSQYICFLTFDSTSNVGRLGMRMELETGCWINMYINYAYIYILLSRSGHRYMESTLI